MYRRSVPSGELKAYTFCAAAASVGLVLQLSPEPTLNVTVSVRDLNLSWPEAHARWRIVDQVRSNGEHGLSVTSANHEGAVASVDSLFRSNSLPISEIAVKWSAVRRHALTRLSSSTQTQVSLKRVTSPQPEGRHW